jgi:acetate kinase
MRIGNRAMILVLNTGSSSIKLAVFDHALTVRVSGSIDGIGGVGQLILGSDRTGTTTRDHDEALALVLDALATQRIDTGTLTAAAHRIVHGGETGAPTRLDPTAMARIEAYTPLAPLHNPHALAAIRAMTARAPSLPQYASFDTAFHATNPAIATTYALPAALRGAGIRRYGFHGLSYAGMVRQFADALPDRLLALHLGNGVSLCAIHRGRSIATSMGYSPLSGPTMGTRSGDIDAAAVLRLASEHGIDGAQTILSQESGLKGLSGGTSDMRALLASDSAEARFAVAHFCYWAARHAGSLIAAMGGVDAIAFTGGIGEHAAPVRAQILDHLRWLGLDIDPAANAAHARRIDAPGSACTLWVVPADEERQIAIDALALIGAP